MRLHKPQSMSYQEATKYAEYLQDKYHRTLESLTIEIDPADADFVGLTYTFNDIPFERIRRITGYLVGTMDHWNNAKKAEERDRVKHNVGNGNMEAL